MPLLYQDIFNQVGSMLNALETYGDTESVDPTYSEFQIADAIAAAELKICEYIVKSPGHRRRADFLATSTTTTNPYTIPASTGDIVDIQIKLAGDGEYFSGEPCNLQVVSRFAKSINPLELTLTKGLYSLQDGIFWFTGHTAQIRYLNVTKADSPTSAEELETFLADTPFLPAEYWLDCAVLAMSILLPKEGALTQAASYYAQLAMASLQGIQNNAAPLTLAQTIQEGN